MQVAKNDGDFDASDEEDREHEEEEAKHVIEPMLFDSPRRTGVANQSFCKKMLLHFENINIFVCNKI